MKILYLGTGASEGIPAMFCACDTCKRALKLGGRNIMTRSQMLINDNLLIDFNTDTYSHFLNMGKTLSDIEYILITHSHTDHFTFEEFFNRYVGIAYNVKAEKLKIYLSKDAYDVMMYCTQGRGESEERRNERFEFIVVEPFVPVKIGEYLVTPLPAVHMNPEQALIYLIEKDGKTLFYGNDTGMFSEKIDDYLQENGKKIDLISLDCTKCDNDFGYNSHMSMKEGREIADRFLKKGLFSDNVKLYYNHFSHNGGQVYDELIERAEKYGFKVAYDGLEITL